MMPRRKLPTPPRLSNTGYVAVDKSCWNDWKMMTNYWWVQDGPVSYETDTRCMWCVMAVCVSLCRPGPKSPRWTQSSTPRGFMISSPLSCHSLQEWQGAQRHMGKRGQVEGRAGRRNEGGRKRTDQRVNSYSAVLACFGSPSSVLPSHTSIFLSLCQWGAALCS